MTVDAWLIGLLILVFVILAVLIPRQDGHVEHSLDQMKSPSANAELNANIERARNVPPPSA